jgi:hypothetical protein
MAEKVFLTLKDFSLGINKQDGANLIPDAALVETTNAIIGKGFVSKRSGYEQFTSSPVDRTAKWSDIGGKKWSEL